MSETAKPAKVPAKSARRRAREFALQGLYQWRIGGNDEAAIESHLHELEGFDKADGDFCIHLIRGVLAQREELAGKIARHVDRPFEDLSPIEACILLIGAFELLHHPETPYRVIINEAIELAKAFGGTDGHKYVNGVLDKVAADVRAAEVEAKRQAR
jgi:N utilization substance protein B